MPIGLDYRQAFAQWLHASKFGTLQRFHNCPCAPNTEAGECGGHINWWIGVGRVIFWPPTDATESIMDNRPHHVSRERIEHDRASADLEARERAKWGPIDDRQPRWEGCEFASRPPWSYNGRCMDARCLRCWGRMTR